MSQKAINGFALQKSLHISGSPLLSNFSHSAKLYDTNVLSVN